MTNDEFNNYLEGRRVDRLLHPERYLDSMTQNKRRVSYYKLLTKWLSVAILVEISLILGVILAKIALL